MNFKQIQSKENKLIKYVKALHKTSFSRQENVIIIEGIRVVLEVLKCKIPLKAFFLTKDFYLKNRNEDYFQKLITGTEDTYLIDEKLLKHISQVETSSGFLLLAGVNLLKSGLGAVTGRIVACLDNIKDPGNLGTILRTSLAMGVKDIILSGGSVSPYNSKVIRGSAGAVFKLNIYLSEDLEDLKILKNKGYKVYSTSSHSKQSLADFKIEYPSVFVFGRESSGISGITEKISDAVLSLPLKENVESLNVSAACAVFLYEAAGRSK
ncbi:MAG: RNA methyltransferase [Armatimonadota bacterium]